MGLPLLAELKRRRVFRALVGYGIAAFAVLQIIEPVMHGFHWPDSVLSYVVAALAVGFPIVVTLAWIFDVNQGRIERTAGGRRGAHPRAAGQRGGRIPPLVADVRPRDEGNLRCARRDRAGGGGGAQAAAGPRASRPPAGLEPRGVQRVPDRKAVHVPAHSRRLPARRGGLPAGHRARRAPRAGPGAACLRPVLDARPGP